MKKGDRVLIKFGDNESHMCEVCDSGDKAVLLLVKDDGEIIASVQQFWRTAQSDEPRKEHVALTGGKRIGYNKGNAMKCCEAPGCPRVYSVKKADLARGWGKTCSKSCAAKLREANKNAKCQ